jgi:recombination DNA repair RAD52 pathway protein
MATAKKTTTDTEENTGGMVINQSTYAQHSSYEQEQSEKMRFKIAEMQSSFNEHFPREVEKQLKKGGASLTYIPVSEVITRLNKVLGFDGWSYEIVKTERDSLDPDFIIAHVRLSVYLDSGRFTSVTKDGFGGQKIKRTKQGDIVDLGDEYKGAVSDALKKAAQTLGIALYLARTEEAMEIIDAVPEPTIDPKIVELWDNFIGLSKTLDANGKSSLNSFWASHAGNRPKPTKQTATINDLEALINECVRISFNGSEVIDE